MEEIHYLDFDLQIERVESGYRARIVNSPAGQADTTFTLPFSELELENFILRVGRSRRGMRRLESPETEAARKFGASLFEAVFDGEMRGHVRSSMREAQQKGAGLRFRLRLSDAPELAELPWEYLYDSSMDEFLVLSVQSPIVRYLDLPLTTEPLTVSLPLKVLVMISSPSNYPELDVQKEYENLEKSLGDLVKRGLVELTRLEKPSLVHLQRQLRRDQYHIFHFVGHGGYDQQAQDGVLVLEDENGLGRPVSGRYIGTMLHDHRSLRLAVLNACEGARTSRNDPFSGVAHSLVQKGIPGVIAMQFEISDEAAIVLAREFYGAIADGYPIDASLAEARKAVFAQNNDIEWGTPVLYMRSPDGRIFGVQRKARQFQAPEPGVAPAVDFTFQARPGDPAQATGQPTSQVLPSSHEAEAHRGLPGEAHAPGGHASWAHEHTIPHEEAVPKPRKKSRYLAWFGASLGLFAIGAVLLVAFGVIDPGAVIPMFRNSAGSVANSVAILPVETSAPSATPSQPPTDTPTLAPTEPEDTPLPVIVAIPTDTATPTLEPLPTETPTQGPTPVGSGSGQIAFASDRSGSPQIWLVDIDGNNAFQLTDSPGGACQPAWKPDGTQLVFISPCPGNQLIYENSALYLINTDGTGLEKITEGIGGGDYDPAWSPDGTRIAFASDREDFTSIYILDVVNRGEPVALTRNSPNQQPEWSPDGSQIVFVTFRLGSWQVYKMPHQGEIAADGDQARQFSRQNEFYYSNPRWSPDGQILIFTKQLPVTSSQPDLFGSKVADNGLKEFPVSTASGKGPMREGDFSPDGRWIAYEGWPTGSDHDIWIMTANGSDRRPVTQDSALDFDAAWRP